MVKLIEYLKISDSPYVNAILSILAFMILAKIVDLFIDKLLRRMVRFTKSDLDDKIMDVTHGPVCYTIIMIGCVWAIVYMKYSEIATFYILNVLYSVIAVIWALPLAKLSNIFFQHALRKESDETGLRKDIIPLVENVVKIAIVIGFLTAFLMIWEVDITPLMASAGIAGLAIAIAAKDTLSNFFGGISVFIDRPYKLGDYIVLSEGERGEVVKIGIRSTRIKTRDDVMVTVPNSLIANSKIVNESAPVPDYRIRIPISVAYGSDIDKVQETLLGIAGGNGNVLPDPAPRTRFREFGDSALLFELLCWVTEPAVRGRTIHDLNTTIYKKFIEQGIIIPFPQRDVHLFEKKG